MTSPPNNKWKDWKNAAPTRKTREVRVTLPLKTGVRNPIIKRQIEPPRVLRRLFSLRG